MCFLLYNKKRIILITLFAVLAKYNKWTKIELFARKKGKRFIKKWRIFWKTKPIKYNECIFYKLWYDVNQKPYRKNNKIPMWPKLLKQLNLKGCIVTIDALNTQRKTIDCIIDDKADYAMTIKGN